MPVAKWLLCAFISVVRNGAAVTRKLSFVQYRADGSDVPSTGTSVATSVIPKTGRSIRCPISAVRLPYCKGTARVRAERRQNRLGDLQQLRDSDPAYRPSTADDDRAGCVEAVLTLAVGPVFAAKLAVRRDFDNSRS